MSQYKTLLDEAIRLSSEKPEPESSDSGPANRGCDIVVRPRPGLGDAAKSSAIAAKNPAPACRSSKPIRLILYTRALQAKIRKASCADMAGHLVAL